MISDEGIASNKAPVLNEYGFSLWSTRIRVYIHSLGYEVWNSVISDYIPPRRIRTTSQKESKQNNSREMEAIFDGFPQPIKEKIGPCLSTKDIWVKLEKLYSVEQRTKTSSPFFENEIYDEES